MEILGAITALRGAYDLVRIGVDARDDAKVRAAVSDMAERLLDAFEGAMDMSARLDAAGLQIKDLAAKLEDAKKRLEIRESYVLREVGPGVLVYSLKASPGGEAVPHYVCQVCLDEGKRSILQRSPSGQLLYCLAESKHNIRLGGGDGGPRAGIFA